MKELLFFKFSRALQDGVGIFFAGILQKPTAL